MLIRCPTCGSECVTTANCPTCTRNRLLQEANDIARKNSYSNTDYNYDPLAMNSKPFWQQIVVGLIVSSPTILFICWFMGVFR